MSLCFRLLVLVSIVDVISCYFGLSCRDVKFIFLTKRRRLWKDVALAYDDQIQYDVINNSVRRRRVVIIDDTDGWESASGGYNTSRSKLTPEIPTMSVNESRSSMLSVGFLPGDGNENTMSAMEWDEGWTPTSASEVCQRMNVPVRRRLCAGDDGTVFGQLLIDAVKLSLNECREQFLFQRWNCGVEVDQHRIAVIERGLRESSFLHAISSAALVHTIARACSRGLLATCTCDRTGAIDDVNITSRGISRHNRNWHWAGCGDNVRYASRLARRAMTSQGSRLSPGRKRLNNVLTGAATSAEQLRIIDSHNYNAGITILGRNQSNICKCHGVSGSCSAKTCWRQLASFPVIGSKLRSAYDQALPVGETFHTSHDTGVASTNFDGGTAHAYRSSGSGSRRSARARRSKLALSEMLVYAAEWPNADYCDRSPVSLGTRGRHCPDIVAGTKQVPGDRCDELCCGRGHNVLLRTIRRRCHCHLIWCCDVRCEECADVVETLTCK